MRRYIYPVLLIIFLLFSFNVHALTCTDEDYNEYASIARKVKISYQHIDNQNFDIIITNLGKDMFLIDDINEKYIYGTGDVLTLHNYNGNMVYTFRVFFKTGSCNNQRLYTVLLKIPRYNTFADSAYCDEYPSFKYCDPWYKGYISYDKVLQEAEEYEKSLKEKKDDKTFIQKLKDGLADFYNDNKMYIFIILGVSVATVTFVIIHSIRSRRKIEIWEIK